MPNWHRIMCEFDIVVVSLLHMLHKTRQQLVIKRPTFLWIIWVTVNSIYRLMRYWHRVESLLTRRWLILLWMCSSSVLVKFFFSSSYILTVPIITFPTLRIPLQKLSLKVISYLQLLLFTLTLFLALAIFIAKSLNI